MMINGNRWNFNQFKDWIEGGGGSPPLLYPNGSKLRNLLDTPEH